MQNSDDSGNACLADCGSRIVLRVASVDDDRTLHLVGECNLRRESCTLGVAWRVVVVVVESALPHRYRPGLKKAAQLWYVPLSVERRRIVGVNTRSRENEARVFRGVLSGDRGG